MAGKKKTNWEIERDKRIALKLRLSGLDFKEIADKLNISERQVSRYVNQRLKATTSETNEFIKDFVATMINSFKIDDEILWKIILTSKNPKEQVSAIREKRENKKSIFEVVSKTGLLNTVKDEVNVNVSGDLDINTKLRGFEAYIKQLEEQKKQELLNNDKS
jgi:predicted transcriptional regulator